MVRNQLVPVADAENRQSAAKNGWIDIGATGLVDTAGASRNDNSFTSVKVLCGCLAGLDIGKNAQFANLSRNQVRVLSAGIEDSDLGSWCGPQRSIHNSAGFRTQEITVSLTGPLRKASDASDESAVFP